ncbi:MAG: indolepyruvate oxidoreductase subunit beta [Firmicutes bacterium ADurb.Bin456]|nr:MAG: indolepyruvate oxidoreductase subunit beta [Firmicutes bacterium ADurb.Bin456]
MLKPLDIIIVGVGGQGTLLAGRVLTRAAQEAGYDIKVSEIHGMAQRGGSVVTQVRLGERVFAPMIGEGKADFILAFEKLEGLRLLPFLKPGGIMIINDQAIPPVPVLVGAAQYPENVLAYIRSRVPGTLVLDALGTATRCGNPRAVNMVLLGALAANLPVEREIWDRALRDRVPEKFLEANIAAFAAGYKEQRPLAL